MVQNSVSTPNSDESLTKRLFIARLSFLRFDEKCILEANVRSLDDLLHLSIDDISFMTSRVQKTTIWNPSALARMVERDVKLMQAYGISIIFYDSPEYPYLLRQIYDPPYALYCRGCIQILDTPCIGIVGTRKPSSQIAHDTKVIAQDIAKAGIGVVSGLAFGIDSQAHMGALLAQGIDFCGKTIAVLGSGVDTITPTSNKRLASAILASGGCIISEYQPASPVQKWQFVQRNRIISALSRVVVVMEAPAGSGALFTADFAIEHNRELCFYKGALGDFDVTSEKPQTDLFGEAVKNKRCAKEYVQDGATIIESANDVLSLLHTMTFLEEREFSVKSLTK